MQNLQNIEACGYSKHIGVSLPVTQRFEFRTFKIGAPTVYTLYYKITNKCTSIILGTN